MKRIFHALIISLDEYFQQQQKKSSSKGQKLPHFIHLQTFVVFLLSFTISRALGEAFFLRGRERDDVCIRIHSIHSAHFSRKNHHKWINFSVFLWWTLRRFLLFFLHPNKLYESFLYFAALLLSLLFYFFKATHANLIFLSGHSSANIQSRQMRSSWHNSVGNGHKVNFLIKSSPH